MAGVAPERAISKRLDRPSRTRTIALPRLRRADWLPPLVVALAVLVALIAAYTVRPFIKIDLGDYYDSAYLDTATFNSREIGRLEPITSFNWPQDRIEATFPGNRDGLWTATFYAGEDQAANVLRLVRARVNGADLNIVRPTVTDPNTGETRYDFRRFTAVIPAELAGAEQLTFDLVHALSGNPPPEPGLVERVELSPARSFRWSQGNSSIELPGLGRGDWQVTLSALVQHPNGEPINAVVSANGTPLAQLTERGGPQRLSVMVPAALMNSGDLTLKISAQTYNDPRPLGVLLWDVAVTPMGRAPLLPPLSTLVYALVIGLGVYWSMLRMTWRRWLAAGIAVALVLAGAWLLATARYPTAFMPANLAALMLWSLVLLFALERCIPWLFRRAGVPVSPQFRSVLLLIFFVGYWIKAGAMLYPYYVGIDVGWHMDRVRDILNGQFAQFYGINSPLNETTMPTAEWGENRPVIPYSPWFHIFATTFTLIPLNLSLTGYMFGALIDTSQVFLIALLARKGGLTARESLFGALIFAITPVTFLLHSWGNLPTTFGMWWTLVSTTYIVALYPRLDQRWPFVGLLLLLIPTLLIYTVMAAFMLLFIAILIPALLLWSPRGESRRPIWAIALATALALGFATLVYYGQYITPIIERTIPYFTDKARYGEEATGVAYDPFGIYLAKYWGRMSYFDLRTNAYGLQLLLPLGLLGMALIRNWRMRAVFLAWLAVAIAGLIAGSRVSMVDKHLFYLIPALAVGTGWLAGRLWRRGIPARLLVSGFYLMTFAAAIQLWVHRVATVQQ